MEREMKIKDAGKYLHLIQALADGETIQIKPTDNSKWLDYGNDETIGFSYPSERYRIKPSLMEFYAITNEAKTDILGDVFKTREDAEKLIKTFNYTHFGTVVHLREVE
jgi:hypothetical protein